MSRRPTLSSESLFPHGPLCAGARRLLVLEPGASHGERIASDPTRRLPQLHAPRVPSVRQKEADWHATPVSHLCLPLGDEVLTHSTHSSLPPPTSTAYDVLVQRARTLRGHRCTLSGEYFGRSLHVEPSNFDGAQLPCAAKYGGQVYSAKPVRATHDSFARSLSSGALYCCDRVLEAPDRARELHPRTIGEPLKTRRAATPPHGRPQAARTEAPMSDAHASTHMVDLGLDPRAHPLAI